LLRRAGFDVAQLLEIARTRQARTRHLKSKLEPHRAFIVAAVVEGLSVTTVQAVLEENCGPFTSLPPERLLVDAVRLHADLSCDR
jgi:hypothetical protein